MKVLVCGGRDFNDYEKLTRTLNGIANARAPRSPFSIIQGGARGADRLADEWAAESMISSYTYKADWDKHGKAAGPIRNQRMLDEGKPDLVVAFPGGRGTADMINRAKKAGIEVIEIV